MAAILFYIPGAAGLNKSQMTDKLKELGLIDHVAPGSVPVGVAGKGGPDGGPGCVVHGHGKPKRVGYHPDDQRWTKADGYWIGTINDDPPGPDDLKRKSMLPGHDVELADGNRWRVPLARRFGVQVNFPRRLLLDNGVWVEGDVLDQYASMSGKAQRVYEVWLAQASGREPDQPLEFSEGIDIAVEALAINYHLSARIVSALGLLTTDNWSAVLQALVDAPRVLAWWEAQTMADNGDPEGKDGWPAIPSSEASTPGSAG